MIVFDKLCIIYFTCLDIIAAETNCRDIHEEWYGDVCKPDTKMKCNGDFACYFDENSIEESKLLNICDFLRGGGKDIWF